MSPKKQVRVAIIGGGVSGMMLAIELQQRGLTENVTIYEKATQVGGTWRDNTYPGAACDVPSHLYSYSKVLNPDWSEVFSSSTEIQQYWLAIHRDHKIADKTKLDSNFQKAVWDQERSLYVCDFSTTSGETFQIECEVLVSAIGALCVPSEPVGMKGFEDYGGTVFHSARWDHSVPLANTRVAIIGSGCSASQIVPIISQDKSTQVTVFQRTPNWYLPRGQASYSALDKFLFRYVPGYMFAHRFKIATRLEINSFLFPLKNEWFRNATEEMAVEHMTSTAPAKYHSMLTPNYPIGCKRIIVDPGFLAALNQSNVELTDSGIECLTADGIRTKDGKERAFDVVVLATGFDTGAGGYALDITGRGGATLRSQWDRQAGPQAYLGTAVSSFPNFFTLLGPNIATGHSSVIFSSEAQINLVCGLVAPLVYDGVRSLEVKQEVEKAYNVEIATRLKGTVWNGGCKSWYQVGDKLVSTWPGTLTELWWRTRSVNWNHLKQEGGVRLAARRDQRVVLRVVSLLLVAAALRFYGAAGAKNALLALVLSQYEKALHVAKSLRA